MEFSHLLALEEKAKQLTSSNSAVDLAEYIHNGVTECNTSYKRKLDPLDIRKLLISRIAFYLSLLNPNAGQKVRVNSIRK